MGFGFRILFEFVQNGLDVDHETLTLWDTGGERIWLQATNPLSGATRAALRGVTYATEDDARDAASRWLGTFVLALTRGHIDVDFLERRALGTWSDEALVVMQNAVGPSYQAINERSGVLVHLADVEPVSVSVSATGTSRQPPGYFVEQFRSSVADAVLRDHTTLAYQLFSARGRFPTDAQLLTMVSAVEALIDPQRVGEDEQVLIDELLQHVDESSLSVDRRVALHDRIGHLRRESINHAGRRLSSGLRDREYDGMTPARFFTHVYAMRSSMSHGGRMPDAREVGNVLPHLTAFVRDLIELSITESAEG